MNVTYVTSELPYPVSHGGIIAMHCVIQALAKNASVSVVVLTPGRYSEDVVRQAEAYYRKTCCSFVCHQFPHLNPSSALPVKTWHYLSGYPRHGFWSKEAQELLVKEMQRSNCEVLWCNSTHDAKYLARAKQMGCKTVLMTHNVESDLVRQRAMNGSGMTSWVDHIRWYDMRRLEKVGTRLADAVTAITDVDYSYYVRLKGSKATFLLPFSFEIPKNGAEPNGQPEEPSTLCFIGSMDWPPNIEAARFLVHKVMPIVWQRVPDARCFIVGKSPGPEVQSLASEKVVVTGRVESVRSYYHRAAVAVVPIQAIGGLKIKLIEAMAEGKAIVCTSAGAAGVKVEDGKHVRIADNAPSFADAIVELLNDQEERRRLGDAAGEYVAKHLSPNVTENEARRVLDYIDQL